MESLFLLILNFFQLISTETPNPGVVSPEITFEYAASFDKYVCPLVSIIDIPKPSTEIKPDLIKLQVELQSRLPELQRVWNENGPLLLRTSSVMLNSKFSYERESNGLFLCTTFPSWAKPRLISVWQFMPSVPDSNRWSDEEFVDVVFHEHLHMLVNRLLDWKLDSVMLKKYEKEELFTKIHLHVYAVQKAVYQKTGRIKVWELVEKRSKTFPKPYQRAIEIVNTEGAGPFIEEIRNGQ